MKINKKYKLMLFLNLALLTVAIIIFSLLLIFSSFETANDKTTTIIILIIFSFIMLINVLLIFWLKILSKKEKKIPICFKVSAIIISLPVFLAMLIKPEHSVDLFK